LHFATTRKISRLNISDFEVVDGRDWRLAFGMTRVRVPEGHKAGRVERPLSLGIGRWTLYRGETDDKKHFTIKAKKWMSQDQFVAALNDMPTTSALVFVHGFNTTFEEGMFRLAQIVWDTQYKGAPILFSWP